MTNKTANAASILADRPVTAVMSGPVVAIHVGDTLNRALQAFVIADLHHLAVIDQSGHFVGLLSDRTIAAAWLNYPAAFDRLSAADLVARPDQPFVTADASVRDAASVMHSCGTDAAVVLDARRHPVGVVTAADLVRLIGLPAAGDRDIADVAEDLTDVSEDVADVPVEPA